MYKLRCCRKICMYLCYLWTTFLFFFVCLCTAVDAALSFYSLKSNFMTSIQSPSEWGTFRLAVGYAGLYRNFCNTFFSMERKSVKCSLKWQAFWVALQPILYSVPSKEGLKKKLNWCSRHVTAYRPVNIHLCRFSHQHVRHVRKGKYQKYYCEDGSTQGMFPL